MTAMSGPFVSLPSTTRFALDQADLLRLDATRQLNSEKRSALGQFFTPAPTSRLMASMFQFGSAVELLDAGAGIGSLTAAVVEAACESAQPPQRIRATAYEIDSALLPYLEATMQACQRQCESAGIEFVSEIKNEDFI